MNRIARLGIALALGACATAASAQVVERYVTYGGDVYVRPAPVEVVRVENAAPREVIVYDARYAAPAVVARDYSYRDYPYAGPRETIVVQAAPGYSYPMYDPRHPQMGHLIDQGLFNRRGPNDFGR